MRVVTQQKLEELGDSLFAKALKAEAEVIDRRGTRNLTLAYHLYDRAFERYRHAHIMSSFSSTPLYDKTKACMDALQRLDPERYKADYPNGYLLITFEQASTPKILIISLRKEHQLIDTESRRN